MGSGMGMGVSRHMDGGRSFILPENKRCLDYVFSLEIGKVGELVVDGSEVNAKGRKAREWRSLSHMYCCLEDVYKGVELMVLMAHYKERKEAMFMAL